MKKLIILLIFIICSTCITNYKVSINDNNIKEIDTIHIDKIDWSDTLIFKNDTLIRWKYTKNNINNHQYNSNKLPLEIYIICLN